MCKEMFVEKYGSDVGMLLEGSAVSWSRHASLWWKSLIFFLL